MNTYLSRIELQEFRGFSSVGVDLAPKPGALIVYGSNGLGKSSFFDGIEWALTGKVDHLQPSAAGVASSKYLRRWNSPVGRDTQVSLHFAQDSLRRSLSERDNANVELKGFADVTAFLKRIDWEKRIEFLDRYLLLTHFLGQSAISRMTHRDPKSRWEFFQEPAQSDRATRIVRALHGHGASAAARAFERRANELEEQAARIDQLLQDEEQLWQDAHRSGAIDELSLEREVMRLMDEHKDLGSQLHFEAQNFGLAVNDLLEVAVRFHAAAGEKVFSLEAKIQRARALLRDRQEAEVHRVGVNAALRDQQARADQLQQKLLENANRLSQGSKALEDVTQLFQRSDNDLNFLLDFERFREGVLGIKAKLPGAKLLVGEYLWQLGEANDQVRRVERVQQIAELLANAKATAQHELDLLEEKHRIVATALVMVDALRESINRCESLTRSNDDLPQRLKVATQNCELLNQRVEFLRVSLEDAQRTAGALSTAVASIAAQMAPDACDCPVCATTFPSAGELRDRVSGAVDRLAPALVDMENQLTVATRELKAAELHYAAIVAQVTDLEESQSEVSDLTTKLVELLASISVDGEPMGDRLKDFEAIVKSESNRLKARINRIDRWLRHRAIGAFDNAENWAAAIRTRNQFENALAEQNRNVQRLEADLQASSTGLDEISHALGIDPDISDEALYEMRLERIEEKQRAEFELASLRAKILSIQSEEASTNADLSNANAQVSELFSQALQVGGTIEQFEKEWLSLDLGISLMETHLLEERARDIPRFQRAIQSLGQQIQLLRDGRVAWSRQELHRNTLERIASELDLDANSDRDEVRTFASRQKEALLQEAEAVTRAKAIAKSANGKVEERVEEFNQKFLAPLGALMDRINKTILSDSEYGLQFEIGLRKIEQRVAAGPNAPDYVRNLRPELVYSEGQMAALAVSMLTAASLTFAWSRWPALVMDDPLQHNDVVHAAGFADMLRNLILTRSYQVLLSTHDAGQAEFLRRKFRAAEIPCTMVHLVGRGDRGVVSQITYEGFTPSR